MQRRQVTRTRLLLLGGLTLLVVLAWVGSDIYHSWTAERIRPQVEQEVLHLDPTLQLEILDNLETKRGLTIDFTQPLQSQTGKRE